MAKLRRGRAKRLILDVGSSAVRLCEISQTKTGYQLTKYFHREFNFDPSIEEEQQRQLRKETITALLKDAKVRYKKTVFGVPGQSVFTRTRALPPVPEYKVTQIVRYEIQQQIPFSLDQIAFDYQVLQRTEAGGYDVLMAAIKVDVVEKRLDIIRDIKKQIHTVDVCPLAAYNWLKTTGEFGETGECIALIDLGASTTDIVIERDNLFRFTRSLNLGGNDVTSAIAAEFNVSFVEAEKLKRERGFAPTGDVQRDGRGGEIVGRILNRLVSEITRSFAYFRSQPGGGPVSRIVVTGGGACLRNMIPFLQRQLGVEVRIAQPLAGLAIGPGAQEVNEHPEQAAVALGLALRCCQNVPIAINLIPPRITEAARRREQIFYWALSVATLALILASIIPKMAQDNKKVRDDSQLIINNIAAVYDKRIINVTANFDTWHSGYEDEYDGTKKRLDQYEGKVAILDKTYLQRTAWMDYMVEINDIRPKGKLIVIWSFESTKLGPPNSQTSGTRSAGGFSGLNSSLGASGQSSTDKYSSTGFEGVSPGGAGGGAFRGGGGSYRDERRDSSMRTAISAAPVDPGVYNGITIRGFAGEIGSLLEYVEALKKSTKFVKVFFEDRYTDPVAVTAMDNAGGGANAAQATAQSNSPADRHDQTRRDRPDAGSRLSGLFRPGAGNLNAPPGDYQAMWNVPGNILTFRIDLQISGQPADQQVTKPTQTLAPLPAAPAAPRTGSDTLAAPKKPASGSTAAPADKNSLSDLGV